MSFLETIDERIDERLPLGWGGRFYGVYPALVKDIVDPLGQGRVRIRLPWAPDGEGQDYEVWARLATMMAGNERGTWFIPDVGDEVLVVFQAGDVRHPFVIGALWNGSDTIPFTYPDDLDAGNVTYAGWTSRTGHKISFFESSSESKIQLLTANGEVSVVFDDKNKEVRIETTGKMIFDAQQDVEIKAGGSMKLEASGQMTVKGSTIALN